MQDPVVIAVVEMAKDMLEALLPSMPIQMIFALTMHFMHLFMIEPIFMIGAAKWHKIRR